MSDNLKDLPVDEIPLTDSESKIISSLLDMTKTEPPPKSLSIMSLLKIALIVGLLFFLMNIPQVDQLIAHIPFLGATQFNGLILKTVVFLIFVIMILLFMTKKPKVDA